VGPRASRCAGAGEVRPQQVSSLHVVAAGHLLGPYVILGRRQLRRAHLGSRFREIQLRQVLRGLRRGRPGAAGEAGADPGEHDGSRLQPAALPAYRSWPLCDSADHLEACPGVRRLASRSPSEGLRSGSPSDTTFSTVGEVVVRPAASSPSSAGRCARLLLGPGGTQCGTASALPQQLATLRVPSGAGTLRHRRAWLFASRSGRRTMRRTPGWTCWRCALPSVTCTTL